ncbi:MAG: hypothetical protein BGO31_13470 [Bacteroidetes bacterium 43-16]|nr:MAG: hypothetical protein BGO31_13470 [Bacteroidetes bacterium 43-16]
MLNNCIIQDFKSFFITCSGCPAEHPEQRTNPEQIKQAIAAAGFDADEVKATADAYEKLDGCCKAK